ncbi:MAG TPA: BON domain-containing protein, partial [Alphaproteobacteria bacterium]|nr:BON domain-containing protein [Alphaproteobacteria bacterium]
GPGEYRGGPYRGGSYGPGGAGGDYGDYGRGPHRGRGPRGYRRSAERIREDVSDRLAEDPYIDVSDVEVGVDGSEVTLSGSVADRLAKRRAEDLAEWVTGATHVQNNLRVRGPGAADEAGRAP